MITPWQLLIYLSVKSGFRQNKAKCNVAHFDSAKVRGGIPILEQGVNGHPLTWLENGATSQKPNQVIDAVSQFYQQTNSNAHQGAHELADKATDMYEDTRETV